MAELIQCVYIDGTLYRPGDEVPADAAKLATNPKLWDGQQEAATAAPEGDEYADMKVDELEAEIELRNSRRESSQIEPASKKKADLIAALKADDEN